MAVVGLLLILLMTATDLLVARNLTAGIDDRLRDELNRPAVSPLVSGEASAEHDFSAPVLRWTVSPRGSVTAADPGTPPCRLLTTLSGYTTATIAGTEFRWPPHRSRREVDVVAASTTSVGHDMSTLLITELIVGPLLLLSVFAGSFVIGRRVVGPSSHGQRHLAFTADASHELRTPLSVIQAETSLLSEDSTGQLRNSLERIRGETDRMRRIVEDLLWRRSTPTVSTSQRTRRPCGPGRRDHRAIPVGGESTLPHAAPVSSRFRPRGAACATRMD